MIFTTASGAVRCLSRCKRTSEWFHLGSEQEGTGFIITIINSRDRSATFLKEVVEFKPIQALSPEEQVLLNEARKA